MKLNVIIPAFNESESLTTTVESLHETLIKNNIEHEIIIVNDNSTDSTEETLSELQKKISSLICLKNTIPNGFGYAVRTGLENLTGDCVAIMMADLSDSPDDLVLFYNKMLEGYDCVFGSRFMKGSKVIGYPFHKLILNRIFNFLIRFTFRIKYNDTTNAFKLYKKEVIEGIKPFLAPHYNLTLELPLKAIVRGYSYAVLPNSWINRKYGFSKFKIKEMGSRYLFIFLYCLIEKYFSKGDFKK